MASSKILKFSNQDIKCTVNDLELPTNCLGRLKAFANLEDKQGPFLLEFASLQHLNLIHIQNQLAFLKSTLSKDSSPQEPDLVHLRRLMLEYGKFALRVYSKGS
jgi:hypothetical protein